MVKGSGIQRSFRRAEIKKLREEQGLCLRCGKEKDSSKKTCSKCIGYISLKVKEYYGKK